MLTFIKRYTTLKCVSTGNRKICNKFVERNLGLGKLKQIRANLQQLKLVGQWFWFWFWFWFELFLVRNYSSVQPKRLRNNSIMLFESTHHYKLLPA